MSNTTFAFRQYFDGTRISYKISDISFISLDISLNKSLVIDSENNIFDNIYNNNNIDSQTSYNFNSNIFYKYSLIIYTDNNITINTWNNCYLISVYDTESLLLSQSSFLSAGPIYDSIIESFTISDLSGDIAKSPITI